MPALEVLVHLEMILASSYPIDARLARATPSRVCGGHSTPRCAEDVRSAFLFLQEERVLREELRAFKEEEAARMLGRRAYSPALGADTPTPLPPFRRWGSALTPEDAHPRYGAPSPAQ